MCKLFSEEYCGTFDKSWSMLKDKDFEVFGDVSSFEELKLMMIGHIIQRFNYNWGPFVCFTSIFKPITFKIVLSPLGGPIIRDKLLCSFQRTGLSPHRSFQSSTNRSTFSPSSLSHFLFLFGYWKSLSIVLWLLEFFKKKYFIANSTVTTSLFNLKKKNYIKCEFKELLKIRWCNFFQNDACRAMGKQR